VDCISFRSTGFFSKLILDYLDQEKSVKNLYSNFPNLEGIKHQIKEKENHFPANNREVLSRAIEEQYKNIEASQRTKQNIEALKESKTFTIVTGHQLNLFTGPLYFLYKIISTINLAKKIEEENPEYKIVPVYWMATEDHDFDEINYFNFRGKKIQWNKEASGAVGRLNTEGLREVFAILEQELGTSKNAIYLKEVFKNAYLKHDTLSQATRYLANEFFKEHGLVIVIWLLKRFLKQ